tara:strand:- start:671 stop:1411 length:741 start_codon:yes stop_codon:yes gene_type:complete
MATEFEVDQLYQEVLGRPFNDGFDILNTFTTMTPEEVKNYLIQSPEGQFQSQFQSEVGRPMTDADRNFYMNQVITGNYGDSNADGVVNINDILFNIAQSDEAQRFDAPVVVDQTAINAGFSSPDYSVPDLISAINPNVPTVPLQITGGSQILPTPLPANPQFYGVDPMTGLTGLLSSEANPMFRSGVAGFTDVLPYQFEFGIPAVTRNVPYFSQTGAEDFVDVAEAKQIEQADANKSTTTTNPRFA